MKIAGIEIYRSDCMPLYRDAFLNMDYRRQIVRLRRIHFSASLLIYPMNAIFGDILTEVYGFNHASFDLDGFHMRYSLYSIYTDCHRPAASS